MGPSQVCPELGVFNVIQGHRDALRLLRPSEEGVGLPPPLWQKDFQVPVESSGQPLAIQGWLPTTNKVGGGLGGGVQEGSEQKEPESGVTM